MIVNAISLRLMKMLSFHFPQENILAKTIDYNCILYSIFLLSDFSFLIGISYNIGYIIVYYIIQFELEF